MMYNKALTRRGLNHTENWDLIVWGKLMNYIQKLSLGRWEIKRMDMNCNFD
jgi:hypothetical protein